MEDIELASRPGLFSRIAGVFSRNSREDGEDAWPLPAPRTLSYRYHITVRRQVVSFSDAVAAADGLKQGEQQILNLNSADVAVREKIKDFLCGVNYANEGTWEELGENIYLLAPAHACVDVAPASPRMEAVRN